MVKADLTRDYYGDLDLQPGADSSDIKKQFKKLALTYHPDRNPGREDEVTAKFQKIQSAHEVLTDPQERAKYDANRLRASTKFGTAYAGASGVRGNPWADVASQYPPPPKHPTARRPAQQPSSGADKYKKWDTPKPQQSAYEAAGARKSTYEAWENMKSKQSKPQPQGYSSQQPAPGKTWKAPEPPPRGTPMSGRHESNSKTYAPPPKPRPGYDEFRAGTTFDEGSHRRSHSTNAASRKGFMPNTPGGDEPAAPMGAYFTQRTHPAVAPDLPARASMPPPKPPKEPIPTAQTTQNAGPDPLRQFRESNAYPTEPRVSTPYAAHGGEKLNPFESSDLHRSKSTREPRSDRDGRVPRTGSDPNLSSPHRSQSFADRTAKNKHFKVPSVEIDSDSSDDVPRAHGRFGNPRRKPVNVSSATQQSQQAAQTPETTAQTNSPRKLSKISQFRQWYKENPDQEPPLNGFPPDGPPLRSGQAQTQPPQQQPHPQTNGEPSMYAPSVSSNPQHNRNSAYPVRLPKFSETSNNIDPYEAVGKKFPTLFPNGSPSVVHPSGITEDPSNLTPFEGLQRNLVDQLLINKRRASSGLKTTDRTDSHYTNQNMPDQSASRAASGHSFTNYRESAEAGSPSKKSRFISLRSRHPYDPSQARAFWSGMEKIKSATNPDKFDSFSFNINDDTFKSSSPVNRSNGFSHSAENISTKFSTEDWDGKFAAGADYFKPEQRGPGPSRTQSGSRSRGRSPVKPRSDSQSMGHQGSETETVPESPGGTKFSAQEWADTFKPQTFAPPPVPTSTRPVPTRKRTGPSIRPTMGGNAAVVDDGETSDEKPLFSGPKPPHTPIIPSPDAMDVDDVPATRSVPQFQANTSEKLNTSPKRPAAPSQSPSGEAALKVNFDDLKIQDLLSSLEMPRSPTPPHLPETSPGSRPSQASYEDYQLRFARYMTAWDLYNKQFMLHLVARKNQNDALGTKRWFDDQGLEIYRRGLKEDGMVLTRWAGEKEKHEGVVKEWVVMRETMRQPTERPRKKTH